MTSAWFNVACLIPTLFALPLFAFDEYEVVADVSVGPDRGQNYGTLFEWLDDSGTVIGGAGVVGVYNTQPRGDRELLQVFVRPKEVSVPWHIERLPPVPSQATGFYPFSISGRLYIHNRSEKGKQPGDPVVYSWNDADRKWIGEPDVTPYSEKIAGKTLSITGHEVMFDGKRLLSPVAGAQFAEHYFASGKLFLKEARYGDSERINRLIVCPWNPEEDQTILIKPDWTVELPIANEFIYAFGQYQDQVIAVSNNGRVLRFANGWTTLREPPVPAVSYQVYSILNYGEKLLFGHYPTGEILEYDGIELKLLKGWPPVMTGVSSSARETQTLMLYGGDVFAGVWPWAELWRYDSQRKGWAFVQRMMNHPLPSGSTVHPYESETRQVDSVGNLWGQRITGLQPHRDHLFITTSSKGGTPWENKFSFLSENQRSEYGAVYRASVPGTLSVAFQWKPTATRISIQVHKQTLSIRQDGELLGQSTLPPHWIELWKPSRVQFSKGVFGNWAGSVTPISAISKP